MSERADVDMVNMAMDLLGKGTLASIDPDQKFSGALQKRAVSRWRGAFDHAMKMTGWDECTEKASLPGVTVEGDEARIKVQLPGDCLKVISVGNSITDWTKRAGPGRGYVLTCGPGPVKVEYTRQVPAGEMSEQLARLCAAQLAVDLLPHASLTRSERDEVKAAYRAALVDMIGMSGAEDGTDQASQSGWLASMDGL